MADDTTGSSGIDIKLIMGPEEIKAIRDLQATMASLASTISGLGSTGGSGSATSPRPPRPRHTFGARDSASRTTPRMPETIDSWSQLRNTIYRSEESDFLNLSQVPGSRFTVSDMLSQVGSIMRPRGFYLNTSGESIHGLKNLPGLDPRLKNNRAISSRLGENVTQRELRAAMGDQRAWQDLVNDPESPWGRYGYTQQALAQSVLKDPKYARLAAGTRGSGSLSPYLAAGAATIGGAIYGTRRIMSPNSFLWGPNNAARSLGYEPSMNPFSSGSREQWGDVWQGMKDSWFGFNPYFSASDAMAVRNNMNTMGYRGSARDQMYGSAVRTMRQTGLSAETTMKMLDRAYKASNTSMIEFEKTLKNFPAAAKGARISTEQLASTIDNLAAGLSTDKNSGFGYTEATKTLTAMAAGGLSPEVANKLLSNEYLLYAGQSQSGMSFGEYMRDPNARIRGTLGATQRILSNQYGDLLTRASASNTDIMSRRDAKKELEARMAEDMRFGGSLQMLDSMSVDEALTLTGAQGGLMGIADRSGLVAKQIGDANDLLSMSLESIQYKHPEWSEDKQRREAERALDSAGPGSEASVRASIEKSLRAMPGISQSKIDEAMKEDDMQKFLQKATDVVSVTSGDIIEDSNRRLGYLDINLTSETARAIETARQVAIDSGKDPASNAYVGRMPGGWRGNYAASKSYAARSGG